MAETIAISGIWVRRAFPHLGGKLEIYVEVDGKWRRIQQHSAEGYISHITEVAGIEQAPVDTTLGDH